jgi:hypothetical protein
MRGRGKQSSTSAPTGDTQELERLLRRAAKFYAESKRKRSAKIGSRKRRPRGKRPAKTRRNGR